MTIELTVAARSRVRD